MGLFSQSIKSTIQTSVLHSKVYVTGPFTVHYAFCSRGNVSVNKENSKNILKTAVMQCKPISSCPDSSVKTKHGWLSWLLDNKPKKIINKDNVKKKRTFWNLDYYKYLITYCSEHSLLNKCLQTIKLNKPKNIEYTIRRETRTENETKVCEVKKKNVYMEKTRTGDQLTSFYPEPRAVLVKKGNVILSKGRLRSMDDFVVPPPYEDKIMNSVKTRKAKLEHKIKPTTNVVKEEEIQPNVNKIISFTNERIPIKTNKGQEVVHLNPFDKLSKADVVAKNPFDRKVDKVMKTFVNKIRFVK